MGFYTPYNRLRDVRLVGADPNCPATRDDSINRLARIARLQADLARFRNEGDSALGIKVLLATSALGVMVAAGVVLLQGLLAAVASLLGFPPEQAVPWLAAGAMAASGFALYGLIISCLAPTERSVYRERELTRELNRLNATLRNGQGG